MSGTGRAYVAPVGGGEWTDVGYVAEVGLLPQNLIVHGIYERCDRCQAPAVEPFPDGWRLDVHVAKRGGRIAFTPHRPDCDAPTLGHVMPGVKLLNMDIDRERWGR